MHELDKRWARKRWVAALLAPLCVCLGLVLVPAVASAQSAQDCDSAYGCTPTTPPPGTNPDCFVSGSTTVSPGETVTATLINVPIGTPADLTFDGNVVAHGVAEAGVGGSSAGQGGMVLSFTVPTTASAGRHELVFVAAGVLCDATHGNGLSVVSPTSVLGNEVARSGSSRSSGGGLLARTGVQIALALAIALALLVIGAALVKADRRRRRRQARARNDVADLVNH